jgi:hypothetical protein
VDTVARGEMVEAELDRMIERRSLKGETDPDEQEDLWVESLRRYQERERHERRAEWYGAGIATRQSATDALSPLS